MRPDHVNTVADFMRNEWHLIVDDESAYKPAYVASIAAKVRAADDGEIGWGEVLRTKRKTASRLLGWRVFDELVRVADAHPTELREAAVRIASDGDADTFWRTIDQAEGTPERPMERHALRGIGARASVASYFLFVRDPMQSPMYRTINFASSLVRITGEPLDNRSPGAMLNDYYRKLDVLAGLFRDAGLPVRSRLDVQGVLWVVTSRKVLS